MAGELIGGLVCLQLKASADSCLNGLVLTKHERQTESIAGFVTPNISLHCMNTQTSHGVNKHTNNAQQQTCIYTDQYASDNSPTITPGICPFCRLCYISPLHPRGLILSAIHFMFSGYLLLRTPNNIFSVLIK